MDAKGFIINREVLKSRNDPNAVLLLHQVRVPTLHKTKCVQRELFGKSYVIKVFFSTWDEKKWFDFHPAERTVNVSREEVSFQDYTGFMPKL